MSTESQGDGGWGGGESGTGLCVRGSPARRHCIWGGITPTTTPTPYSGGGGQGRKWCSCTGSMVQQGVGHCVLVAGGVYRYMVQWGMGAECLYGPVAYSSTGVACILCHLCGWDLLGHVASGILEFEQSCCDTTAKSGCSERKLYGKVP